MSPQHAFPLKPISFIIYYGTGVFGIMMLKSSFKHHFLKFGFYRIKVAIRRLKIVNLQLILGG